MQTGNLGSEVVFDTYYATARGALPAHETVAKFGYNANIATTRITVWNRLELYPWPSSATTLSIVSTSTSDTVSGTGAQVVLVDGLDANYRQTQEILTMNGITPVVSTKQFLRVFRFRVLVAGSGGTNAGTLTATGASVLAQVDPGDGREQSSVFTIPSDRIGLLTHIQAASGKASDATITFWLRPFGGVFWNSRTLVTRQNSYSTKFDVPQLIPAKSDIEVRAMVDAGTGAIAVDYEILMLDPSWA